MWQRDYSHVTWWTNHCQLYWKSIMSTRIYCLLRKVQNGEQVTLAKPNYPVMKDEEIIRKAEMLMDSGTQKTLRGLAYLRVLRTRVAKAQGSHQFTLTNEPDVGKSKKKNWVCKKPSMDNHRNPEYKIIAVCWGCGKVFTKTTECSKCRLFICPFCGKCGCTLGTEALTAVYCTLESVFGFAELGQSYWRNRNRDGTFTLCSEMSKNHGDEKWTRNC